MLLRGDGDDVIAIGQPAHAWLSGQLARAWGNERFGAVEPWEEVCLAAEQHDVGMAPWERRPTLNPETGLPRSFMELALDEHLEIWWRAAPLVVPQSRYAALLVSLHGSALYERRNLERLEPADVERVQAFLQGQRELQERLLAGLRADPRTASSTSRSGAAVRSSSTRGRSPLRASPCAARGAGSAGGSTTRRRCAPRSRARRGSRSS